MDKYRIVESYDLYLNPSFELQKKHFYMDRNGNIKYTWRMIYCNSKIENCEKIMDNLIM